jgi:eukaryotic-like serine/threonine-protein kinase
MIGTKLAHFEITSHLGSGGMGEVYEANDSKLGRSVAIKFLPEAFSHDSERVARFQREARVLAALNHADIAAIYGLEEIDGRHFLVMELVPGETLAQRIQRGAIPLEEALGIAIQITEALEAAHEKGIIHRDLKPANIKVTPEGKVKVLDFGLAKAYEREQSDGSLSNSPTMSIAATNAGVIFGTAAYMSPEQAKGRNVDKRADIFAFGCVLYEMLTGRPVFDGDDVQDILGAVLRSEPDWTRLPADTAAGIRKLLRRCLEKNVKNRRADAADVRIDIEESLAAPATASSATSGSRGSRVAWMACAAALLAAVVLAIPAVRHFRETPAAVVPEMRVDIVTPATVDPVSFALSPDGRQIVFSASGNGGSRLWLRSLNSTAAQPLPGTEGAIYPFWAPNSQSIGFFADSKLKRLDVGSGLPQTITPVNVGRGGTWNKEGVILFAQANAGPISRVSANGGTPVEVTKVERAVGHRFPYFLPDGREFLFYVAAAGPADGGLFLGSVESGEVRRLTPSDTGGVYMNSGWLAFVRGGTLVAQRLDLTRGALAGDPVTLGQPVSFDALGTGALSVSATGLIAYRSGNAGRRQLTWFDRSGKDVGTLGAPDENDLNNPSFSPDSRRAVVIRTVQGNPDIWVIDGVRATRLTFDAASDVYPVWSADGTRIVFDSNRKGFRDLYQKFANGAGSDELLLESKQDKTAMSYSPDGRFLLYRTQDPKTGSDLWVLPLEGNRKPFAFLNTPFDERSGVFSPDGKWIAYQSNESGRIEIYVRPFPGPGGQWQISTAGGIQPRWSHDGKELYYIAPDEKLMAAAIAVKAVALEPGVPVALFQTRIWGGGTNANNKQQYDVTADGRFLINITTEDDAASPITLLQNWRPPSN